MNESKRLYPKNFDSHSRLHNIWRAMKSRCYIASHGAQKRYAAKGIIVCSEWKDHYKPFLDWALSTGYNDALQLYRKDNDDIYSPENCRWVTAKQNTNNKDNNVLVTALGEIKTLSEWAQDKRCVVTYQRLWARYKLGIDFAIALQTKILTRRRQPHSEITKQRIADKARLRTTIRDESGRFASLV